ncbi:heme-binding protein 1-like [Amphibalanus amphitrite]|uniref:heme-binding protein 1-like n=1 Tax=Amphibalanus amphitrite TaxID=1232801 RepID=UPI001C8FE329|nr:heme-binding protein 1-like [Amphibalanus amphitrite]
MRIQVVLLVALAAVASADEEGGILDSIRNGFNRAGAAFSSLYATYETAPYTVERTVKTDDGESIIYEERNYPGQKWVCTTEIDDEEEEQSKDAFMRLFGYITGDNEGGITIPMTTPVSMVREPLTAEELANQESQSDEDTQEQESEEVHSKYTMCFYINQANQENAPPPTNPEVYIENRPTMTVIASQTGGYMDDEDWVAMADKLKQDATAQGETGVDYSSFYRAGYDSPMKFWNRRNEIWYVKQA